MGDARLLDIARDHPEALAVLLECGVAVRDWGRVVLDSIPDSAMLAERISGRTAWRGDVG